MRDALAPRRRILVACEFSGAVRRAFAALGWDAWSCDLLPAEDDSPQHVVGDARELLGQGWDLLIAHPPCTRLCASGVRWLREPPKNPPSETSDHEKEAWSRMSREEKLCIMWRLLAEGADLFGAFWNAPVKRIAVENPVMHGHAKKRIPQYEEFAQSVQPWQFGHGEVKRTCLWLRGLPPLEPSAIVEGRETRVHRMGQRADRWKERSRTLPGIAAAMAEQWTRAVLAEALTDCGGL